MVIGVALYDGNQSLHALYIISKICAKKYQNISYMYSAPGYKCPKFKSPVTFPPFELRASHKYR